MNYKHEFKVGDKDYFFTVRDELAKDAFYHNWVANALDIVIDDLDEAELTLYSYFYRFIAQAFELEYDLPFKVPNPKDAVAVSELYNYLYETKEGKPFALEILVGVSKLEMGE